MLIKCTLGGGVQAPQEVCKFKFCELFRRGTQPRTLYVSMLPSTGQSIELLMANRTLCLLFARLTEPESPNVQETAGRRR